VRATAGTLTKTERRRVHNVAFDRGNHPIWPSNRGVIIVPMADRAAIACRTA